VTWGLNRSELDKAASVLYQISRNLSAIRKGNLIIRAIHLPGYRVLLAEIPGTEEHARSCLSRNPMRILLYCRWPLLRRAEGSVAGNLV
jgi:hypothetical protein